MSGPQASASYTRPETWYDVYGSLDVLYQRDKAKVDVVWAALVNKPEGWERYFAPDRPEAIRAGLNALVAAGQAGDKHPTQDQSSKEDVIKTVDVSFEGTGAPLPTPVNLLNGRLPVEEVEKMLAGYKLVRETVNHQVINVRNGYSVEKFDQEPSITIQVKPKPEDEAKQEDLTEKKKSRWYTVPIALLGAVAAVATVILLAVKYAAGRG